MMRTNQGIRNPYLRSLAAREAMGWRQVYARSKGHPAGMTRDELWSCIHAAREAIGRVDLHLRRHPDALLAGDVTPLADYPASFAGHV